MACLRYDAATRTFYQIKPTQLSRPDRGEHLSFKEQVMRGYKKAEAKGEAINGRAAGIKRIWNSN